MILLVADLRELKSNPKAPAAGTVLESRVDKGRGAVATIMVQTGTLHTGDVLFAALSTEKFEPCLTIMGARSEALGRRLPWKFSVCKALPKRATSSR